MALGLAGALSIGLVSSANAAELSTTVRVSFNTAGVQGNDHSYNPSLSADARYVAFHSAAANLVGFDTNGVLDVFVRDTVGNATHRVSVSTDGDQATGVSTNSKISANGRYVVFQSAAVNLVPGDTNSVPDIFLHDLQESTTTRVSVSTAGAQVSGASGNPSVSADGSRIAFHSTATNLVAVDTNSASDIFVRDITAGTTTRVSVSTAGAQGNNASNTAVISGNGRYVTFYSTASNLVAGSTASGQLFVRYLEAGTTSHASVSDAGATGNGATQMSSMSHDGRFIAFMSYASNLAPNDGNGNPDIFLRDTCAGVDPDECTPTTTRITRRADGYSATGASSNPVISADGRRVTYSSTASDLVAGDTNGKEEVFVYDAVTGTTSRVSTSDAGVQGNDYSVWPSISADGNSIAYWGAASNLVSGDTNGKFDIFVSKLKTAPKIATQPSAVSVDVGSEATLTVAFSGNPAPSIRWQSASAATGPWTDISGATSDSFAITPTDAGTVYYRAIGTNSEGSATSAVASVTATAPLAAPAVTMQPDATSWVSVDTDSTFVAAFSGNPAPTIQWQSATAATGPWTDIEDATAATLTVTPSATGTYYYRAVATNSQGNVTTTTAELIVTPALEAPAVTAEPTPASATVGGSATLTAAFSGYPAPAIQWQSATSATGPWTDVTDSGAARLGMQARAYAAAKPWTTSGATSTTLTVTPRSAGTVYYQAVGTNSQGTSTTGAVAVTAATPAASTGGGLAATGASGTVGALTAVSVLVGAGVLLLVTGRRRSAQA